MTTLAQFTAQATLQATELHLSMRAAHSAACTLFPAGPGDAIEVLLIEAVADAARLRERLALISRLAAADRYLPGAAQ